MMSLQNFAFEEHLVRVTDIEGDPWFVGKDVCHALGIRDHKQALSKLDQDELRGCVVPPQAELGGCDVPPQVEVAQRRTMNVVSEPGVYRLIFTSRKPEAERFKRWLAHDVLPALRRDGHFGPVPETGADMDVSLASAPLAAKVGMLQFVARVRGKEAAVAYMRYLGLPEVPALAGTELRHEANTVLEQLLGHEINGQSVRDLVTDAMDGEHLARQTLAQFGIKTSDKPEGFFVGSACSGVQALFEGQGSWLSALRRLPGVVPAERQTFAGLQSRSSWVPMQATDIG